LESGLIGRAKIEEKDLEKVRTTVREVSAGIRQQKFEATPAYMACTYCAYNQICPSAEIR
jgi:CRISPR/Cas system-associated exonuclease Cas4 (RecB family)